MRDLLSIIGTDIRTNPAKKVLSNFSLRKHRQADELDEGVETEYWFSDKRGGIEVRCDNEHLIKVIFLHSGRRKREASKAYSYPLIEGLSINSLREDVRAALGKPTLEGAARRVHLLGEYGAYDRYDYADWSIHFRYTLSTEQMETVTIMSKDWVPRQAAI